MQWALARSRNANSREATRYFAMLTRAFPVRAGKEEMLMMEIWEQPLLPPGVNKAFHIHFQAWVLGTEWDEEEAGEKTRVVYSYALCFVESAGDHFYIIIIRHFTSISERESKTQNGEQKLGRKQELYIIMYCVSSVSWWCIILCTISLESAGDVLC